MIIRCASLSETDRRAGGVYLWETRAAAEAVYNGEWKARVKHLKTFGCSTTNSMEGLMSTATLVRSLLFEQSTMNWLRISRACAIIFSLLLLITRAEMATGLASLSTYGRLKPSAHGLRSGTRG
jgi:hypothetical protein